MRNIPSSVRGSPPKLSKTSATQVIDCSLCYRKRYRSAKSGTKRILNSFYAQVIRLLNNSSNGHPDYLHWHPFVVVAPTLYTLTGLIPQHTLRSHTHKTHTCILMPDTHTLSLFTYAAVSLFIIYPHCLVTFTPTHMYILNYLDYLVPLHIDSLLVLLVYSLVIVFIVSLFPFLFLFFLLFNSA
jgi:hypothetical protein